MRADRDAARPREAPAGRVPARGPYTLLDRDRTRAIPSVVERGLGVIVGVPYNSSAPVGGPNFEYARATPATLDKVARIKTIADRHGVGMKAAGLPFSLAKPAVAAVIPGASRSGRIAKGGAALEGSVSADFWLGLREGDLVIPATPLLRVG